MIERGDGAGFAFKAVGELLRRDFDGDVAIEPRIAGLPYLAHAAFAEGRDDLIGAEAVCGGEGHWSD